MFDLNYTVLPIWAFEVSNVVTKVFTKGKEVINETSVKEVSITDYYVRGTDQDMEAQSAAGGQITSSAAAERP